MFPGWLSLHAEVGLLFVGELYDFSNDFGRPAPLSLFNFMPPQLSGMGLALIGTTVEQDAAYWECHIEVPDPEAAYEVMFGVATKKDRKFYDALAEQEEGACLCIRCHRVNGCMYASYLNVSCRYCVRGASNCKYKILMNYGFVLDCEYQCRYLLTILQNREPGFPRY